MSDFPYKFGAIIDDKGIGFFDWIFWEKDFKSKSKSKTCWIFGFFKSTDQMLPTFGCVGQGGLRLKQELGTVNIDYTTRIFETCHGQQ